MRIQSGPPEPIRNDRILRPRTPSTDAAPDTAPAGGAAAAGEVTATTSLGADVRAETAPARAALAGSQDGATVASVASEALGAVAAVLGDAAASGDVSGVEAAVGGVVSGAVFGGQPVLGDLSSAPLEFVTGADGATTVIAEDLRVDLRGGAGVVSVDVLGAPPTEVADRAAAAIEQLTSVQTRIEELRAAFAEYAITAVEQLTGEILTTAEVEELLGQAVSGLRSNGGLGVSAQANLPEGTPDRVLG